MKKKISSPQVPDPPPQTWSNCLVVGNQVFVAGMVARGQSGAVGGDSPSIAGPHVLAEPVTVLGDFTLVPADLPLVLADLLLVAGDLPAVLSDLVIVVAELALILPDFPDITRNLPTVLADVPVVLGVRIPLILVSLLGAHDGCPQRDRHDRASHEPRESMHGAIPPVPSKGRGV